jgi:SAM-dependent MidA family methyltransferase
VPKDGDIQERCADHVFAGMVVLADLAAHVPMAALFIDYGHTKSQMGETLQAVSRHKPVPPLYAPGETDLTAQVDFDSIAGTCDWPKNGVQAKIDGPVTQAELLGRLGIIERASRLMSANPAKAAEIEAGVARLIAPGAMGSRFKAIGIRSASLPPLPGFPVREEG